MRRFLKAQASSLIASATDFVTTIVLKEVFHVWYLTASVLGTITGGIVNFLINRNWVFQAARDKEVILTEDMNIPYEKMPKPAVLQVARYGLVWVGNLALNAAGVYLLTHYCNISYLISKIFVSVLVGFSYNYLLQKHFVFSKT